MSRIGLKPIVIPAGVEVTVNDANTVTVKGSNGTLTQDVNKDITVTVNGSEITLQRPTDALIVQSNYRQYVYRRYRRI